MAFMLTSFHIIESVDIEIYTYIWYHTT